MFNGRAKETEILIASGQVKQTQDGVNYLLTTIEEQQ